VFPEELVQVDVHGRLVVPDQVEGRVVEPVVEHVAEMEVDPACHAAHRRLAAREGDLLLGDGDTLDPAAEATVGDKARSAPHTTRVEQTGARSQILELIHDEVGLRGLQPVQLADDPPLPGRRGAPNTPGS
jgi:hypothetical protein